MDQFLLRTQLKHHPKAEKEERSDKDVLNKINIPPLQNKIFIW